MNDADTRIKDLINSAVDRELGGHRSAPPLDRSRLAERPPSAHPVARWSVPVLAAVVAALLTIGAMLAIGFERNQRVNPPANSVSPAPWATPSVSRSTNPDAAAGNRAYAEAVARAVEASQTEVSSEPLTAEEAVKYKDTGLWTMPVVPPAKPAPGKPYPVTLRYLVGPSDKPAFVLSWELLDLALASCPPPFLARPGHAYVLRCQVTFLAGVPGKLKFTSQTPTGTESSTFHLTPDRDPASPSTGPEQEAAAREYSEAVASAPEASKVAGVSDRPATAEELRSGESTGSLDAPVLQPERGRTYPLTLLYIRSSVGPAISVLAIEFEDVTSGSCPRAFRTRPGHAYVIRCQVAFTDGVVGKAYYRLTEPQDGRTIGKTISMP